MAIFYGDIGKECNDLLDKGYPTSGQFKISTEVKTPNGITINSSGRRYLKKGEEQVEAIFEPKFELKERKLELTGKLTTTQVFEIGASLKDLVADGSKISFNGVSDDRAGPGLKGELSFKNLIVAVKGSAQYPFREDKSVKMNTGAVFRYQQFLLGVEINADLLNTHQKTEKKSPGFLWNALFAYHTPTRCMNGFINNKAGEGADAKPQSILGLGWYQKVTEALKFGVQFSLDQNLTQGPACIVGGEYKFDGSTTLKGKFGVKVDKPEKHPEFRLGLSGIQSISPYLTATLGADINVRSLLGNPLGENHSFGLELKFA